MTKLILLCIFLFLSCTKTPSVKEVSEVYLDSKDISNLYTTTERYRLRGDKCLIAWEVITNKKTIAGESILDI